MHNFVKKNQKKHRKHNCLGLQIEKPPNTGIKQRLPANRHLRAHRVLHKQRPFHQKIQRSRKVAVIASLRIKKVPPEKRNHYIKKFELKKSSDFFFL